MPASASIHVDGSGTPTASVVTTVRTPRSIPGCSVEPEDGERTNSKSDDNAFVEPWLATWKLVVLSVACNVADRIFRFELKNKLAGGDSGPGPRSLSAICCDVVSVSTVRLRF